MGTATPWGISDHTEKIAKGIISHSTPSHGGYHLSPCRQEQMPAVLRVESGWYEEDCDWCLVAIGFPEYFSKDREQAIDTMRNWHPERYEHYFSVELKPSESYMKGRRKVA